MSAVDFLPAFRTLPALREAVQHCKGCDLYKYATQAVFGEGPKSAPIVFIGEQPGDEEDKAGRPFVGPAGRLFNRALKDAGIERSTVYITNAVKHFKFEGAGNADCIRSRVRARRRRACRGWRRNWRQSGLRFWCVWGRLRRKRFLAQSIE